MWVALVHLSQCLVHQFKQMWLKQTNPAWGDHVSHAGSEILKPVKISIVGGLIGEPGEG